MATLEERLVALATAIGTDIKALALRLVPIGGSAGQLLGKTGSGSLDFGWVNAPSGGGGGSAEVHTLEIDFGEGARSKTFDLSLPAATAGQGVVASVSLDMPAGVAQDELEMDPITCSAAVAVPGVVRVIASAQAPVSGKRNINLILG